ncbi:MAG: hypothetical protein LBP28_06630, partial [Coriobacteriales bacterium]|nr:hypothetical protein [Coriobacteriales bacterium]
MAINLSVVEVQVREERLGSSSLYHGCAADIGSETGGCGQGQGRRCFSQNSGCMNGCAQGYLSQIDDAVIVTHAPIGCSADNVGSYHARRWGNFMQGRPQSDTMALSTDMNESDTIFGGLDKLRDTVCYAVGKYNPKAVFITSSCVSAIIGEDIVSLAAELSQELGIAVVPVSCEGFKTKIWASGFDAAFHAILTGIVKPPKRKTNIVNVIQFFGSSLPYVSEALAVFGMKPRLVAGFNSIAELERLSEAAATVSICGTLGSYLGNGL